MVFTSLNCDLVSLTLNQAFKSTINRLSQYLSTHPMSAFLVLYHSCMVYLQLEINFKSLTQETKVDFYSLQKKELKKGQHFASSWKMSSNVTYDQQRGWMREDFGVTMLKMEIIYLIN